MIRNDRIEMAMIVNTASISRRAMKLTMCRAAAILCPRGASHAEGWQKGPLLLAQVLHVNAFGRCACRDALSQGVELRHGEWPCTTTPLPRFRPPQAAHSS